MSSITTVITDAGFDLLRAAPGHTLIYTKAVCSSGHVDKTQLATLAEVSDYVMDLSIVEMTPTETAATLRLQLDNSKAPQEFQLYQIGVHAKLMEGDTELIGDTLLQVMQYEQPDIVRAIPHISEFVVNTLMGQAETVEGVIDMAAYVSIRQFTSTVENIATEFEKKADGSGVMRWRGSLTQADFDSASSQQSYSGWVASNITGGPYAAYANVWGLASGASNHDTQFWADMNRTDALFFRQGTTALGYSPWNRIGTDTPPQWLDAPLASGWTHVNASDGLKYGRDSRGLLWLRGGVRPTSLTYGAVCCTLPPSYRPDVQQWVDTISSVGVPRTFRVSSEGAVSLLLGSTTLQNNEYILFKTTSFPCALSSTKVI